MSRGRRVALIVGLVVAALLSGGAYAYWYFLIRGPFAGETVHDFGDVALYEETAEVQHTFHLSNRLDHPLTIVAIRPECGCLTVRDVKQTLQPGETFDLPVTLVAKGGPRTVIIHIAFADGSTTPLRVKAVGRYQPRLWMPDANVTLSAEDTAEFTIMLDTYEVYEAPAAPHIIASEIRFVPDFLGWTLKHRPKDIVAAPTNWEGRVRVRRKDTAAAITEGAALEITWPPAKPLTVTVH